MLVKCLAKVRSMMVNPKVKGKKGEDEACRWLEKNIFLISSRTIGLTNGYIRINDARFKEWARFYL